MSNPYKVCKPAGKDAYVKEKKEEVVQKVEKAEPKVDNAKFSATSIPDNERDSIQKFATRIKFKASSDTLNRIGESAMAKVYETIRDYKKARIIIEAHTDNIGDSASNMALSEKRAMSVKAYLVAKGIKSDNIITNWYGGTKPIADNSTEEGQAENRRVAIRVEF